MDGYCERLGPGLWAEPLNAVSNLAFLLASAMLLWRLSRAEPRAPRVAWLLPVLLGVVGLCSLSFHTTAVPFTGALDTLSILVYVLVAVVLLARYGFGVRAGAAWLGAPVFLVFAVAVDLLLALAGPRYTLGGYLPALLGLAGFAVALRSGRLAIAAAVFAVSLTLRTLDQPLCDQVPIGTHWLWHCLNAVVLYLVATDVGHRTFKSVD
ncbi:ceramidase domain-containing protein [Dactylosporangium sp. CA-092794]|uniref:ceramidase domain-containing protein n=1 Tax=Dactylosporangium sp. CA-092794 TaxID=3239929 RepID=UPI003D8A8999